MNDAGPVSVVVPMYQSAATIARAVRSALAQLDEASEVIVVDDGSTDGGADVALALADLRVRVVTQSNRGVSAARNAGVQAAKHPWVALLDADDEWLPGHLEDFGRLRTEFPTSQVAATAYRFQHGDRSWVARIGKVPGATDAERCVLNDYFDVACRGHPPVWSSAVFVTRRALLDVGGFPDGVRSGEDRLTWARLAVRHPIAYAMRPSVIYHLQPSDAADGQLRRLPMDTWCVGPALEVLEALVAPGRRGSLRRYVRHYYLGEASCFVRVPRRMSALRAVLRGARFGPLHAKVLAMGTMALLPRAVVRWIYARRERA